MICPEVLVRALLISSLYNITSFLRLCAAISENLAFRWFCFLTIDDRVFNHSTITYFIEHLGWARSRLRGLWKVDCERYISALAQNLKKAVRRLGDFAGPPELAGAPELVAALSA